MDAPAPQWHEFFDLIGNLETGDEAVGSALARLVAATRAAVSSYRGMRVTALLDRQPVHLDAFLESDGAAPITTSLRLSLAALAPNLTDGQIVFYAATPGAFVDLAADLQYVQTSPPAAIDRDLPAVTTVSGLTGFEEASAIGRATGILINEGAPPDQAVAILHERAAAAGLTPPAYAARLLGR